MRISDWSSDVCSSDLPFTNAWVSVGYNVRGFQDRDFEQAHHTAEGAYMVLRLKFDQDTFGLATRGGSTGRCRPPVPPFGSRIRRRRPGAGDPGERKSTRLNSSPQCAPRMPPSASNTKNPLANNTQKPKSDPQRQRVHSIQ